MSKIFGTDGIRCLVNKEPLTAETCLKISKTVAYVLRKKNNNNSRVVICKDTRLSGYLYEPLVTAGFISMGMDVILVGPLPTPSVPLMIKTLRADIGVMITASHNTYEYNGLKFFDNNGIKLNTKLEEKVEKIVLDKKKYSKITNNTIILGKAKRLDDATGRYSEFLKSSFQKITIKKN
jgi:Phosphomannomutase